MSEARDPGDSGTHHHLVRQNGEADQGSPERAGSLARSQEATSCQGATSCDSLDQREPRSKLLGKWHRNAH